MKDLQSWMIFSLLCLLSIRGAMWLQDGTDASPLKIASIIPAIVFSALPTTASLQQVGMVKGTGITMLSEDDISQIADQDLRRPLP